MYFRCQHCDQPFESADERPRCPRCLRITTVVPLGTPRPPRPVAATPRPYRRALGGSRGVPWTLALGVAMLGASAFAAVFSDFGSASEGEGMGMAIGYAAVGGAGLALALWGLKSWLAGK